MSSNSRITMTRAIVYPASTLHSCQIKSSTSCRATKQQSTLIKQYQGRPQRKDPPFTFRPSLHKCLHISVSKSMACWINLSPLCVSLTRQSSGFMADWICVIKDDKQNHLLVTSICHHPAFAISRTSLKNNSKSWRERETERGGAHTDTPYKERGRRKEGGRWGERRESWRDREVQEWELEGVSESKWGSEGEETERKGDGERGERSKKKEEMEIFWCPSLSRPVDDVALLCPQIVS